jgi:uncharacterized protein YuzE
MQIKYDRLSDALYISLTDQPIYESKIVTPNLNIDLDEHGGLVGLEIIVVQDAGIDPMNVNIVHVPENAVVQRPDQEEIRRRWLERMEMRQRRRAEQEKQEHVERT